MSCGEANERVIHDEKIVTIQILLKGSFAKFAQGSPVPLDFNFWIFPFIFGNSSEQGGITAGMIPSEPFENDSQTNLPAFRNVLLGPSQAAGRFSASKMCSQYKTTSSRWFRTSQASTMRPRPLRFGSSCFSLTVTRVRSVSPMKTGLGKRNLSYP